VDVNDGQGGTCSIPSLSAGAGSCSIVENASDSPYTVTATYNGDSNYASGATNSVERECRTSAPRSVAITGNPNPAGTGSVTYDVTVTGSGATPTGSVGLSPTARAAPVRSPVSAPAPAAVPSPRTPPNSPYTVTATYNGDGNYASGATNYGRRDM
jgi:hypothetical protein